MCDAPCVRLRKTAPAYFALADGRLPHVGVGWGTVGGGGIRGLVGDPKRFDVAAALGFAVVVPEQHVDQTVGADLVFGVAVGAVVEGLRAVDGAPVVVAGDFVIV